MNILHGSHRRLHARIKRAARSLRAESRELALRGVEVSLEAILAQLQSSPAFFRLVDEVVQYLVHHPDVEALIHEQTSSFVVEAVDEIRMKAARADTAFDRMIVALRRRVTMT